MKLFELDKCAVMIRIYLFSGIFPEILELQVRGTQYKGTTLWHRKRHVCSCVCTHTHIRTERELENDKATVLKYKTW